MIGRSQTSMGRVPKIVLALTLAPLLAGAATAQTSSSHPTRHKVRVYDDRAGTIIARAETAIEKRDYATAERLLNEATADDPQDYRAWYDLGFVFNATGRKREAIAAYRKSVAADATLFESTYDLGLLLAQTKDPEAEKYLRAATTLKPTANINQGLEGAWLSLGHTIEAKDPAGALNAYAEAARLQPRDAEPHLSTGALLEQQNKLPDAEKEYRLAAEADPRSSDAVLGLVNVYQKSGRLPEAEAALRKYVALDPQNAAAQIQLGRVLAANHKRYDAIAAYEAAMKLAPGDVAVQRELASLYDAGNEFAKAETVYRALLLRDADDAAAHAGLGSVLLHQRQPAAAQPELIAALKLDPKLPDAYSNLALAASETKNYELTIRALDARAKLVAETPGTYFLRATAYDNLHLRKQAAENYHQFLLLANGRFPDQEWQARHRLKAIEPEKK